MTENLIDRLKKMKKEKEEKVVPDGTTKQFDKAGQMVEDIEQCACGSNLKNECDECDRIDDDHEVLQKIREIGDKKEVNPPKPESKSKAMKVKRNDPSGTCPICQKEFKHLSRHRCKVETKYVTPKKLEEETDRKIEATEKELKKGVYISPPSIVIDCPPITEESLAENVARMTEEELMDMTNRFLQQAEEKDPEETREFQKSVAVKEETVEQFKEAVGKIQFDFDKTKVRKEEEENGHKYDLYINAEIVHNGYENLKIARLCDLVEPFIRQIEEKKEVAHWSLLDYEKGSAYLAALLEEAIEDGEVDCDAIVADSRTKEGKACLDVLQRHAGFVVRGVV